MADYQNGYNYDQIVEPTPTYPVQSGDPHSPYYRAQSHQPIQLNQQHCPTIIQGHHPPTHQDHLSSPLQDHIPSPLLHDHRSPTVQDHQPQPVQDHCAPLILDHFPPPIQDHRQPPIRDHRQPPILDHRQNSAVIQSNLSWPVQEHLVTPIQDHLSPAIQSHRVSVHDHHATPIQDQHVASVDGDNLAGASIGHSNHSNRHYDSSHNDSYNYSQLPTTSNLNEAEYDSSHTIPSPALSSQQNPLDSGSAYPAPISDNSFTKHNQGNSGQTPTSADACMSIVQSLMMHRCGETESFSKRAIESLVKKMKEKRDELDALITAITTSGTNPSKCVTIQRTLDGRLQVAGKKGFPHVIYARIWRWPDLNKNELKHNRYCSHAFDLKSDLVCVNPYHYERIVASGLDLSSLSLSSHDIDDSPSILVDSSSSDSPPSSVPPTATLETLESTTVPQTIQPPLVPLNQQSTISTSTAQTSRHSMPPSIHQVQPTPSTIPNQQPVMSPPARQCSTQPLPEYWCSIAYFELDQQIGEPFKVAMNCPVVNIDGYTDPSAGDRFCLGAILNVHRLAAVEKARCHIGRGVTLEMYFEGDVWLENKSDNSIFLNSPYLDYSYNLENGYKVTNGVHKVYPNCGKLKVFDLCYTHEQLIARAQAAREAGAVQAAAVTGIVGPSTAAHHVNSSALSAAAAVGVDDLRKLCMLSMSFVKGWGYPDYSRADIKKCPCWIEVTLHRALQVLDEVLQQN